MKRKENEKKHIEHVPRYFKEQRDAFTGDKEFVYLGGYWEDREKGNFKDLPDIY